MLRLEGNFVQTCIIMEQIIIFNGTEIIKSKLKESEIIATLLCLGNFSKGFSTANMKKTGLCGSAFDVRVDYNAISLADILDIHNYLMKTYGIVQNV